MLKPPPMPQGARIAGKITVGASWLFAVLVPALGLLPQLQTIALVLAAFLVGSHIIELIIFRAFLQAANASPADYLQTFLFGVFHSGGLQEK